MGWGGGQIQPFSQPVYGDRVSVFIALNPLPLPPSLSLPLPASPCLSLPLSPQVEGGGGGTKRKAAEGGAMVNGHISVSPFHFNCLFTPPAHTHTHTHALPTPHSPPPQETDMEALERQAARIVQATQEAAAATGEAEANPDEISIDEDEEDAGTHRYTQVHTGTHRCTQVQEYVI